MMRWLMMGLILFCVGCGGPGNPTPNVRDTEYCIPAGANLANVCPEMAATPDGTPFGIFCIDTQNNGIFLNPACLTAALNCDQANQCVQGVY